MYLKRGFVPESHVPAGPALVTHGEPGSRQNAKKEVCTKYTLWASDRVVPVPDWAGLAMFAGEWRKFKGWNPVRVPPRARVFPVQGLVVL